MSQWSGDYASLLDLPVRSLLVKPHSPTQIHRLMMKEGFRAEVLDWQADRLRRKRLFSHPPTEVGYNPCSVLRQVLGRPPSDSFYLGVLRNCARGGPLAPLRSCAVVREVPHGGGELFLDGSPT